MLCVDNKKEQTELKATNIISLFHPKRVKKAGHHFGFLKKAGRHQKGAGRRALQKRPRQNTASFHYKSQHIIIPNLELTNCNPNANLTLLPTLRQTYPDSNIILSLTQTTALTYT